MYRKQRFLTGFTLIELLVIVIILSILAGLAVPQYIKTVEKEKMREAEANLYTMYMAEKMYKLDHPTVGYVSCRGALNSTGGCNAILEVEMTEQYFGNWQCAARDTDADGINDIFDCTATRNSGRYGGTCIMQIDETGDLTDTGCP